MATSVETLFSDIIPTARQQLAEQQKQGMLLAQNLNVPGYSAARNLPQRQQAIRQSIGGLLGVDTRTPVEREQATNQELFQSISAQAQQQFPNNRTAQLNFLADELQKAGKLNEAQKARQLAQSSQLQGAKIGAEEALSAQRQTAAMENLAETEEINKRIAEGPKPEIGAINPQDYTPESIQKFATTNNFSDLVRIEKQIDDGRTNAEKELDRWLSMVDKGNDKAALAFGRRTGLVPELSSALEKDYLESSRASRKSSASALRYSDLANQIDSVGESFGGGAQATWTESYKELTGDTDAISSLRTRYKAIRASSAVQNLPPGAASDADVALALQGVPPENANATTVASFLRGLAKLETEVSRYNQAKLKYLDENRSIVGFESQYIDQRTAETAPEKRTTSGGVTYEIIGE